MSLKFRAFLGLWSLLWHLGMPAVLLYIRKRAKRDPAYGAHLAERFGRYRAPLPGSVWIHAVSLGELRSAVPLIRALLDAGETVVTTHFTPAGRGESEKVFADAIAAGNLRAVWVPFETSWAFAGFFRAFRPKYGLVMEIEIWPRMVMAARRARIPLFMCNAQYPTKSIARDKKWYSPIPDVMRNMAGGFVKSQLQADRFGAIGVPNLHVTGELRFDQPIPAHLPPAGIAARRWLGAKDRPVITFASTVEGEDEIYLDAIGRLREGSGPKPLIVYVPRRPERFNLIGDMLEKSGLNVMRRSRDLPETLSESAFGDPVETPDVLVGDSLGEMYFYLSMADRVVVGGGYVPAGAHNIIEPLALKKPVMTGPSIWTIEYPFVEAEAAGVAARPADAAALAEALAGGFAPDSQAIETFFADHAGGTQKLMDAIPRALENTRF